jgi:hypothetical protein
MCAGPIGKVADNLASVIDPECLGSTRARDIDSDEHTVGVDKAVAAEVANDVPASLMPNARVRSPLAVSAAGIVDCYERVRGRVTGVDGCNAQ